MPQYPKYSTTVIGAHSVPDWFEALDRLLAFGQLSMASLADAQFRASQAALLDQEIAGIDVITGGEMHRRTHNRHSPPNAMLNYFWQKIPAFQGSTRPKPITAHDPDVFHPAARERKLSPWVTCDGIQDAERAIPVGGVPHLAVGRRSDNRADRRRLRIGACPNAWGADAE